MPKWTDAQQDAIDARGGNILVSAAAGCGRNAFSSFRTAAPNFGGRSRECQR